MPTVFQFGALQMPMILQWTLAQATPSSRSNHQSTQTHPPPPPSEPVRQLSTPISQLTTPETMSTASPSDATNPALEQSEPVRSMSMSEMHNFNEQSDSSSIPSPPSVAASRSESGDSNTTFTLFISEGDFSLPLFPFLRRSIRSTTSSGTATPSESQAQHTGFICNHCNQSPLIGTRYHCQSCSDWDLCNTCYHQERETETNGSNAFEEFLSSSAVSESSHTVSHQYTEFTSSTSAVNSGSSFPSAFASSTPPYQHFFNSILLAALADSNVSTISFDDFMTEMMNTQPNGTYGAPPAAESAINALKRFKVEKQQNNRADLSNSADSMEMEVDFGKSASHTDRCAVCQEDFVDGDDAMEMPCSHVFHETCLKPWLTQHCTCPNCRQKIADVNDEKLPKEEGLVEDPTMAAEHTSNSDMECS